SALTCTGRTLGETLENYVIPGPEVIHALDDPVGEGPAIAILRGSFAETAVVRLGIRDGSRPEEFAGPARVFEDTAECLQAIEDGVVQPGDVVVARNQGLKGGPAMGGSASAILFARDAAGLAKTTAFGTDGQLSGLCRKGLTGAEVRPEAATGGAARAARARQSRGAREGGGLAKTAPFVTDGQLSGLCLKGLTAAEVAPEAATGGPIGKVRDGDIVRISVANRSIDLDVPAEELAAREGPGYVNEAPGYLGNFRQDVQPMSTGGVLLPRG